MSEATVPMSSIESTQQTDIVASSSSGDCAARAQFAKERFEVELEFIQCLANPWYINIIAQQGYFDKPEFVNYLKYLRYWQRPEYARFVVYPHALAFLDLLQHKSFREEMKRVDEAARIHELQYHHWRWPNCLEPQSAESDPAQP
ncbi:suppressor of hpr1 [Coemansia thaxteri]|nr:suppressor of hpr1 [Coemansia thaxteri]KAJ2470124.1 suppressor of hpr1 [Coemansia sp. RSA 2322]KAJ2481342.1 suppressor of hpr1 [Coemansia sp. RSA 2320]